ncbi:MAG: hypothetical protein LBD44_05790 [Spirochaetaceae bacterium]|jgi:hypothetical protein|nr:hypothetical protein [Spirochaetaceae bacterium]
MKKISSLVVCLVLLSAGLAFALDLPDALKIPGLTVTGDVRTGLLVDGSTVDDVGEGGIFADGRSTGAQTPSVYAFSDDIGDGTSFRAQLQLVWERDNLGVKTRFRYRPDKADGALNNKLSGLNNTVNKAFVYANILDSKVKVSVGKGTDEAWGLFYSNFQNNTGFDGNDGVKIEVKPIDGLNLGAHYGTKDLFANAINDGGAWNDQSNTEDRRFVVGAKYTSDLFSVVAATSHNVVNFWGEEEGYDQAWISQAGGELIPYGASFPNTIYNSSSLLVGLQVKPIDPLQIDLSFAAVNLGSKTVKGAYLGGEDSPGSYKKGDFNPFWKAWLKFKADFAVNDQLSVALGISDVEFADAWYTTVADADDPEDEGLGYLFPITISPSAAYAINDDLTAGLELNLKINSGGSDQFGIGIKPSAEFSLGSGATFVVFDEITFWGKSNDDVDFLAKHPGIYEQGGNKGASGTTNALQFDFVWTF